MRGHDVEKQRRLHTTRRLHFTGPSFRMASCKVARRSYHLTIAGPRPLAPLVPQRDPLLDSLKDGSSDGIDRSGEVFPHVLQPESPEAGILSLESSPDRKQMPAEYQTLKRFVRVGMVYCDFEVG